MALTVDNGKISILRILFLMATVFSCWCVLLTEQGEAKSGVHHLTEVKSYETVIDGRRALRIELAMDRPHLAYALSSRYHADSQLCLTLDDTVVDKKIGQGIALNSSLASYMALIQRDNHRAELCIYAAQSLAREGAYRIYTTAGDSNGKTDEYLVIEIFDTAAYRAVQSTAVRGHTIVIDPGHGGSDSGAVGPTGLREKDVALSVAQRTEELLRSAGAAVIMTRTTDRDVSYPKAPSAHELQSRVDVAQEHPETELFLSVHCNAFTNPDANGMETYYYAASEEGARFATLLNEELARAGDVRNRGVKTANFYVLRHSAVPASLVELAFISNPREEALLARMDYQERLAQALFRAIVRYFE